ncbi:hypothetical protein ABH945_003023 [Paraburkholderia sp. GAS333]|uniref:hypothetical protein n=1 Tax=Paraburkholderia sp. GAS333 TaxID=3156279 RepID=UPI003D1A2B4A
MTGGSRLAFSAQKVLDHSRDTLPMKISPEIEKWSWVAGILGTIVAILAFVGPMFHDSNSNQPGDHQAAPDISGRWDIEQATKIALTKLQGTNWTKLAPDMKGPFDHKGAGQYHLIYKHGESIVVAFATITKGDECHACTPYLSFFEFEKVSDGWRLADPDVGVIQAGNWGGPPTMSVRVIADDRYGIFLQPGYTAQGWSFGEVLIYARIGDAYQKIFEILTDQDDPDDHGWVSEISLIKNDTGFYDIAITRKGEPKADDLRYIDGINVDELKWDVTDQSGNIRPHDKYRFDGQRYVPTNHSE